MSTPLVDFLEARIAEDEKAARLSRSLLMIANTGYLSKSLEQGDTEPESTFRHFDNWAPRRVLAECAAKRWIIADAECETNLCWQQRILAAVWADHPDYDRTWRMP